MRQSAGWIVTHPDTGEPVKVKPCADLDERAQDALLAVDEARRTVDLMREQAARLRVLFRKTRTLPTDDEDQAAAVEQARKDMRDALAHMAVGCPEHTDCREYAR